MTNEALKPCPFCGGAKIEVIHYADSIASCSKCGADGPPAVAAKGRDERVHMATRLWNTRAPERN